MNTTSKDGFRLRVEQQKMFCSFQLYGLDGSTLDTVWLHFPDQLHHAFYNWQKAYDTYYRGLLSHREVQDSDALPASREGGGITQSIAGRGSVVSTGSIADPEEPRDRRLELVKAEAILLDTFHEWLQSNELYEIRNAIRQAAIAASHSTHPTGRVELFLTTKSEQSNVLTRLPWESWDLGAEIGHPGVVQIARTPSRIKAQQQLPKKERIRILAIMGGSHNLDVSKDEAVLQSLEPTVKVTPEGCRGPEDDISDLKKRICTAISNPEGWDILFFAGHSAGEKVMGGELSIAPGVGIALREIEEPLRIARRQGLKLAIFNSCNGVDIAARLIELGLHQVIVMRESIHDEVAPIFLERFAKVLAAHQDCLDALQAARTVLKQELDYPSVDLVPSIFAHPDTTWFQIPKTGWKYQLRRRLPTWREATSIAGLVIIGLLPPMQNLLMDVRVGAQALYRQATAQIPTQDNPPVTLIQIDSESLERADAQRRPIDRGYLADLLTTLTNLGASVIGIDYILDDRYQPDSPQAKTTDWDNRSQQLRQAIQSAQNQETALVFGFYDAASMREDPTWGKVSESLIEPESVVHGDIYFYPWYLEMLSAETFGCTLPACPFAYQLALDFARTHSDPQAFYIDAVQSESENGGRQKSPQSWMQTWEWLSELRLLPIHQFSYNFGQKWLQPILDFSLPPGAVYQPIVAHDLLNPSEQTALDVAALQNSVVIIAPGAYAEAGVDEEGQDNFNSPTGVWAWSRQKTFSGGEAHAYMVHHFLTRYLVYPIPDVWLILLAAWLGKEARMRFPKSQQEQRRWLRWWLLVSLGYGFLGLQLYVSLGILFPWLLPNLMFGRYLQLAINRGRAG